MTIHGSGSPIYASEIKAEFGGGDPFYLSNYYAGGPYVPAGTTGEFGAIPTRDAISLRNFYGASSIRLLDTVNVLSGRRNNSVGFSNLSGNAFGSISPAGCAFYGGAQYRQVMQIATTNQLFFTVAGSQPYNTNWKYMLVGGQKYYNADGMQQVINDGLGIRTMWFWPAINLPFSQGSNTTVYFYG